MYDPAYFRLDEAVALVTGAGAGIGRAIAETFAAAAAVAVTDRARRDLHGRAGKRADPGD